MVITKLQGGLGNQLFEYAAGLAAAQRLNTGVIVEPTYYYIVQNRAYVLDKLGFSPKIQSYPFLFPLNFMQIQNRWFLLASHARLHGFSYIQEKKQFVVDTRLDKVTGNVFLLGFWQHKDYVEKISRELRESFPGHTKLTQRAEQLADAIRLSQSVGVHIRRTDYVSSSAFEPCSVSYYRDAITLIETIIAKPRFFVFSDDIEWVKKNITVPRNTTYISDYGLEDWQEFILLSSCKHLVIANSTFSWWAAWFHDTDERIVVMPKRWSSLSPEATSALSYAHWKKI